MDPGLTQTTAAPTQERPAAAETLQDRADAMIANHSQALAAHGPVAAWDTSGETDLERVFQDAADFNEDLNAYVLFWRARRNKLKVTYLRGCAGAAGPSEPSCCANTMRAAARRGAPGKRRGWCCGLAARTLFVTPRAPALSPDRQVGRVPRKHDTVPVREGLALQQQPGRLGHGAGGQHARHVRCSPPLLPAGPARRLAAGRACCARQAPARLTRTPRAVAFRMNALTCARVLPIPPCAARRFKDAAAFNQDIGRWDTARAVDMWSLYVAACMCAPCVRRALG